AKNRRAGFHGKTGWKPARSHLASSGLFLGFDLDLDGDVVTQERAIVERPVPADAPILTIELGGDGEARDVAHHPQILDVQSDRLVDSAHVEHALDLESVI